MVDACTTTITHLDEQAIINEAINTLSHWRGKSLGALSLPEFFSPSFHLTNFELESRPDTLCQTVGSGRGW